MRGRPERKDEFIYWLVIEQTLAFFGSHGRTAAASVVADALGISSKSLRQQRWRARKRFAEQQLRELDSWAGRRWQWVVSPEGGDPTEQIEQLERAALRRLDSIRRLTDPKLLKQYKDRGKTAVENLTARRFM